MGGVTAKDARPGVVMLEPPRATTPVVEEQAPIDIEQIIPATPRTPVDVIAVPPNATPAKPVAAPPTGMFPPLGHRISPVRGFTAEGDARTPRVSMPVPRPVLGSLPVARDVEGKSLPRAYIARRRSSPKGIPAVALPMPEPPQSERRYEEEEEPLDERLGPVDPPVESSPSRFSRVVTPPSGVASIERPAQRAAETQIERPFDRPLDRLFSAPLTPRLLLYVLLGVLVITLFMSTVVGIIVGKLVR